MGEIIRISEAASLAFHTAVILAASDGERITAGAIATLLNVSEAHLSKVMQRLVKEGIIDSTRGPQGGFVLRKSADDVTLLNLYESMEGPLEFDDCLLGENRLGKHPCILGPVLKPMGEKLRDYLTNTKLASLAIGFKGKLNLGKVAQTSSNN
jgi:Rrf2 family protein